jgi:hypothetical protein
LGATGVLSEFSPNRIGGGGHRVDGRAGHHGEVGRFKVQLPAGNHL